MDTHHPRDMFHLFTVRTVGRLDTKTVVFQENQQNQDRNVRTVTTLCACFILYFVNSAWITEDLIWPYSEYRDKYKSSQRPSRVFQEAVSTAEDLLKSLTTEKVIFTAYLCT